MANSFICDLPADLLKRNPKLSRGARALYGTMRALANGKTGELAIRGNPLDWQYISKQAEICRRTWHKLLHELVESGYVRCERERVVIWKNGRRRVVLGHSRYFVHKQPKNPRKPIALQRGISCKVQEVPPQISSNTPCCPERVSNEARTEPYLIENAHKSSKAPLLDDDFWASNPFLSEEDSKIIRGIRRNLAEANPWLVERIQLHTISDDWLAVAMDYIEARGQGRISSPIQYFTRAFTNFFSNVATDTDDDRDMLDCINEEFDRKKILRKKYLEKLRPLTPEQELTRQAFNSMNVGKASA
jgi:hypothetical protein